MTQDERNVVMDEFESSQKRLSALVEGLTTEQWTFSPAEARWSIADCIEHLTNVESRILRAIARQLDQPGQPEKRIEVEGKDALVRRSIPNRAVRIEAPEPVRPKRSWQSPDQLMADFRSIRQRSLDFAAKEERELRHHFIPHIALGEIDCYQWLVVLGLHGGRHAQQIEEIKAHPAFPPPNQPVS